MNCGTFELVNFGKPENWQCHDGYSWVFSTTVKLTGLLGMLCYTNLDFNKFGCTGINNYLMEMVMEVERNVLRYC